MEQNVQSKVNFLEAIDEIAKARLKTLSYDRTIKAIIIDNTNAEKGLYEVSQIGAEKTNVFTAYSHYTSYKKGEYVYVTIPEGDAASNNKLIIGKYVNSDETYYNYVNPLDGYLDVTGNIIEATDQKQWGLTANYEQKSKIDIWSAQDLALRGYNRLSLQADFKTWLWNLDIGSGTYGLILFIEDVHGRLVSFDLTNQEMYGNPYAYETFYEQKILLDIEDIEEIRSMNLIFMQKNDFYMSTGEKAPSLDKDGEEMPHNIFMQAPYISVGYDVSDFDGEDLRIYSEDSLTFDGQGVSEERTIKAKWVHIPENSSAVIIDDIIKIPRNPQWVQDDISLFPNPETKADLMWFKYDQTSANAHFMAGQGWVEIDNTLNEFTYSFNTPVGTEASDLASIKYKAIVAIPSLRYVNHTFTTTEEYKAITTNADTDKDDAFESQYAESIQILHDIMNGDRNLTDGKTLIDNLYKGLTSDSYNNFKRAITTYLSMRSEIKYVDSGELVFANTGYSPSKYAESAIANINISVDPEGLKGEYLIYDDVGHIIDISEASTDRYCEIMYRTLATVINDTETSVEDLAFEVDKAEMITWYIPLENTMIATPVKGREYFAEDEVIEKFEVVIDSPDTIIPPGWYCKISRVPQFQGTSVDHDALIAEHHMLSRQYFRIKDFYTQLETNNKIYCCLTKDNKREYAVGMLEFGVAGTNGTDSTFMLKMYEINQDGTVSDREASALSLKTQYYEVDKNGVPVGLSKAVNGKIALTPKLFDYNKKELVDYVKNLNKDTPIVYRFFPMLQSEIAAAIASLNRDSYNSEEEYQQAVEKITNTYTNSNSDTVFSIGNKKDDGTVIISWKIPHDKFNIEDIDYYLVIEAEIPYNITYNFLTYSDTTDNTDPRFLSDVNKDNGKKVGDYILDAAGQKQPELGPDGKPIVRADYLKTYLPISIVKNKILRSCVAPSNSNDESPTAPDLNGYYKQIVGANKVIYDRNGSNAKFYKDPYILYNELSQKVEGLTWNTYIRATNLDVYTDLEKKSIASFYPMLTPDNKLQPLETYILSDSITSNFCVYGMIEDDIVCIQPILIMQNKYGSTMMNKWDGNLTIDEKNGIILSSMVGAGIKDKNNTFSGVLMGEVAQAYNDNHNGLGLYGFHQSDQSFGFNIDGRAFIGKAGHGRIWFDGNNGTITSGTYSDGIDEKYRDAYTKIIRPQQGMQIDLDGKDNISSSIHAFGPNGGFVLDLGQNTSETNGFNTPVTFKVFTGQYKTNERGVICFDPNGQYIQSTNYNGFYDTIKTIAPSGLKTQTTPPGWVGVGEDEPAHSPATSGMFIDLGNGWMDARNGIIGGWQLSERSLATPKQEIVLWAGNSASSNDDEKYPYIRLGSVVEGVMQGNLWIADYRVLGATMVASDVKTLSVGAGSFSLSGSGFYEAGEDGTSVAATLDAIVGHQSKLLNSSFSTEYLNSWSLIDDTSTIDNQGLGAALETAKGTLTITTKDDNGEDVNTTYTRYIQIWRPNKKSDSIISTLGTESIPWNNVYAKDGLFQYEKFKPYQKENPENASDIEGWHLVATQEWVAKVILAAANQRIKDVNYLASNALSKSQSAIKNILSWCASWDGKYFITDIQGEFGSGGIGGMLENLGVIKVVKGTVTSNVSASGSFDGTITIGTETSAIQIPYLHKDYKKNIEDLETAVEDLEDVVGELQESIVSLATSLGTVQGLIGITVSQYNAHTHSVSIDKTGSVTGSSHKHTLNSEGKIESASSGGSVTIKTTVTSGTTSNVVSGS